MSVVEHRPEPRPRSPPSPSPAPEPEPEPVKPPPKPVEHAPKPPKEPPPARTRRRPRPAEETIADFCGTTLTGQGGWAAAVGNGGSHERAHRLAQRRRSPVAIARASPAAWSAAPALRVVGEGDLCRAGPAAPGRLLNDALERNYPKTARQQGIEGVARIRVRVLASGKLQPLGHAQRDATRASPTLQDAACAT